MGSERRKHKRIQVDVPARISLGSTVFGARITDISIGGAQIEGVFTAAIGDTLFILFDPTWPLGGFKGKITWKVGDANYCQCGIQFLGMQEGQKVLTVDRLIHLDSKKKQTGGEEGSSP